MRLADEEMAEGLAEGLAPPRNYSLPWVATERNANLIWGLKIICVALMIWIFGYFEHARGVHLGVNSVILDDIDSLADGQGANVEGFELKKQP